MITEQHIGTLISMLGAAILAGIGAAMAWFSREKHALKLELKELRDTIKRQEDDWLASSNRILALELDHRYMRENVQEIKDTSRSMNEKLEKIAAHFNGNRK